MGYEAFVPERLRPEEEVEPDWMDIGAATLRLENPLSSFMESLYYKSEEEDVEGYNVYDEISDDMMPYSEEFLDVRSPDQYRMKVAQIQSELRDREMMAKGGLKSVAWGLVAGLGDPVNLPLMFLPASMAVKAGAGAGRAAMVTATGGAAEAALSETLLHQTQATRTWQETLLNVGGTAVLGGALGALAGAGQRNTVRALDQAGADIEDIVKNEGLQKLPELPDDAPSGQELLDAQFDRIMAEVKAMGKGEEVVVPEVKAAMKVEGEPEKLVLEKVEAEPEEAVLEGVEVVGEGTAGAQRVVGTREQERVRTGPAFSPLNRLLNSLSANAVSVANKIFRHNYYTAKNTTEVHVPEAKVNRNTIEDFYRGRFERGEIPEEDFKARMKAIKEAFDRGETEMTLPAHTRIEHQENVSPVEVDNAHDYGSMSAKYLRTINEQFRAMRKRGVKMKKGEFTKQIGRAMRRGDKYDDIPEIAAAAKQIRADVVDPILKRYQRLGDLPEDLKTRFADSYLPRIYDLRAIEKNLPKWIEMLTVHFTDANTTAQEAVLLARDITDKIRKSPNGKMPETDLVGETGHLKDRVLNIPDVELDKHGFLLDSVDDVMQMYLRRTVPEINLKTRFDGDHELTDTIQKIKDDYDGRIELESDPKKAAKLSKQRDRDIVDLVSVRDIMLGRNLPSRADEKSLTNMARTIRSLSFMANLGMMTISAIPDIARPIMQHGVTAWAKALPRAMLYWAKATKLARRDLEDMGIGIESLLANRAYMIGDIDDFGSALQKATRSFGKYSGMNAWNSYMKKIAAFTAQNRFIGDARNYAKLSRRRRERLAKAGINESMAKRIAKESDKHGEQFAGGHHANTNEWTDREAADLFERVLLKDVDNTIITPGVADRPLFMSKETGKTLLQFKSFFLAAHNQAFIPMMQQLGRGDAAAIQGIMAGLALGMMSEYVRLHLSGRGDEFQNYKMRDWGRAGLDRSGMATVPMELINMADRFTHGKISQTMGMMEGSRYFYRNQLGSLLGPSFGYVSDAMDLGQNLSAGDGISEANIRGIRRLMPYQNMFYLRQLINEMEGAVAGAVGATPMQRRRGNTSEVLIK
jgi:hypothetical protein